MQQGPQPIEKDLVFVGGGHSHAIVLRAFGMKPIPGVRLTLITNLVDTPYSGMLPCHISGLYDFDTSHIDLRPLANFAQCRLFMDEVVGVDLKKQQVLCAHRPSVSYDVLSINTGSTPATVTVPGAAEYAIPAKPVPKLLQAWHQFTEQVAQAPDQPVSIGIVGGGVGGVELLLNMQVRLQQILRNAGCPLENLAIHLFHRGPEVATGRNRWTRGHLHKLMHRRGIQLHLEESVCAVKAPPNQIGDNLPTQRLVVCESGLSVTCDRVFWVTNASAPEWIKASGLATDPAGFIQVEDTLQVRSHPNIFAAGDIATMVNHPRPKAGVFAVRQGKPLFENLQRYLLDQRLQPFTPQTQFLNIIDTGTGTAIASRGPFGWESRLARRWKDWIDGNFMALFTDFPEMEEASGGERSKLRVTNSEFQTPQAIVPAPMHCAGCGAKVGHAVLQRVLQRIQAQQIEGSYGAEILVGLDAPDDAAVISVPSGQVMVQTVDYFRAIVNDPFLFGQISANHCLNDIFAMGAAPQSALAIATIPYGVASKVEETLYQLLAGATQVLSQVKTPLIGGHTTEGAELGFGLTCNGLAIPEQLWRKGGLQPGQALILTKALGTGTLFAADMRRVAKGRWIAGAIQSMLQSNQAAAICLRQHHTTACTDITGFGLLGHLLEMVQASKVAVELDLAAVPILNGARETSSQGIVSSLQAQNSQAIACLHNAAEVSRNPDLPLLFDPQTAGGLLAAVPAAEAEACLTALQKLGYRCSSIVGQVVPAMVAINPIKIL
ncbi:MAG: selenide, water dikinase SelD [Cyanothece sp. SIO1E1]|nr:selenide, water dikinase SelD [Cyanothece sp. SIO1E1]